MTFGKITVLTLVTKSDIPERLLKELKGLGQVSLIEESPISPILAPPSVKPDEKCYIEDGRPFTSLSLILQKEKGVTLFAHPRSGVYIRIWNSMVYMTIKITEGTSLLAVLSLEAFSHIYDNMDDIYLPERIRKLMDWTKKFLFITPPFQVTPQEALGYMNWNGLDPSRISEDHLGLDLS